MNRGIATQTRNVVYATIASVGTHNDLVVVDGHSGAERQRLPLPGATVFTVGTTVSVDGTVYVPSITGDLFAFRPHRRAPR